MSDEQWRVFLATGARIIGPGNALASLSRSWCAWTTFEALGESCHYWAAGLPSEHELGPSHVADGGTWGQPFSYSQLAHVIIPRRFSWERVGDASYDSEFRDQPLSELSAALTGQSIAHRLTDLVLEVKLY